MADSILTTKQVAELFGVHPDTVVQWANTGKLAHFRTPGRHRRFYDADVQALRDALAVTATTVGAA